MSNHYYDQDPQSPHNIERWSYDLRGKHFFFVTDSGVFSKERVDYGSRVLIDNFSWTDLPQGNFLEIGCGYGPIGLALAYASGRRIEMVDINQRALDLAEHNAKENHISQVDIHFSDVYQSVYENSYAAIISNPPVRAGKKVVHQILIEAFDLLKENGTLTIVLQKKQGAPSAKKQMAETFGNAEIIKKDKGYYIIQSKKEGNS